MDVVQYSFVNIMWMEIVREEQLIYKCCHKQKKILLEQ